MSLRSVWTHACLVLLLAVIASNVANADWTRFRGPNGTGVPPQPQSTPTEWSTQDVKWKVPIPGPGHSCPIVVGDRVFVTYWSGYGTGREEDADNDQFSLQRHLRCVNRATGETMWDKSVPAELPEDVYGGMFAQHGYASHTPVSDGKNVYVFFGKTGVLAFDLQGDQLWHAPVGVGLDARNWGSAGSPILYENLVIVPASAESHTLFALNKQTGEVVWRAEAEGFASTWSTPVVVKVDEERTDLVVAVPGEIWGFDPSTGKLRWYCESVGGNSMCSSPILDGNRIYAIESGPGGGGAVAVKVGGEGDVSRSNVLWTSSGNNRITTPVLYNGLIYFANESVVNCLDAEDGSRVYQQRVSADGGDESSGGGRRGFMNADYASPVAADGKIYFLTRGGQTFVLKAGPEFELLAVNDLADEGEFSATPAISDGTLFIRSTKNLYCIGK